MALTEQEKIVATQLKQEGFSDSEIVSHIGASRAGRPSSVTTKRQDKTTLQSIPVQDGRFADVGEDFTSTANEFRNSFWQRVSDIKAAADMPGQRVAEKRAEGASFLRSIGEGFKYLPEAAFTAGSNVVGGAFDAASAPFMFAGRAALSQGEEEQVAEGLNEKLQGTGLPRKYEGLSERGQRNVRSALSSLDVIGLGLFGKLGGKIASSVTKRPVAPVTNTPVESTFERAINTLQSQADDPNLTPRQREEAARGALTLQERYIGLEPDVKARLQEMGPGKLEEYIDAVHIRNIDDTAPTPYEIGSQHVNEALVSLENALKETGGDIGQTRRLLANERVPVQGMNNIDSTFADEIAKLGLTIKNGQVVRQSGVSRLASASDLKVINELYSELRNFKQSQKLSEAVALRTLFDSKIKFGKQAREVSNSVDPLSRNMRSQIAKEMEDVVGAEKAADVERYSEFMDAYSDLRNYTDRRAGGEYLLRLVLSGRGGEARRLVQTIKEYTGIDLMNDATAMKVAVDYLGNDNTKNLFRQEIEKAGYDAAAIISASPTNMLGRVVQRAGDVLVDAEDTLKRAAAGGAAIGAYYVMTEDEAGAFSLAPVIAIGSMTPEGRRLAVRSIDEHINSLEQAARNVTDKPKLNRLQKAIEAAKQERQKLLEDD